MKIKNIFPSTLKVLLNIFLVELIFFTLFRLIFILRFHHEFGSIPIFYIIKSFFVGARFDISLISYTLVPIWILGILPKFNYCQNVIIKKITISYLIIMNIIFSLLLIVNLEFFGEYNSHLNLTATDYLNTSAPIWGMIWGEYPLIRYFLLFLLITFIFVSTITFIFVRTQERKTNVFMRIPLFLLVGGLMFLGIRGRTNEGVMRWGSAFFSEYNIVNQTALNPIMNYFKDYYYAKNNRKRGIDKNVQFFTDYKEAAKHFLSLRADSTSIFLDENYPLLRKTAFQDSNKAIKKYNIVFVLMETFSAELVNVLGSKYNVTPEFDKLAKNGILFTRFYSAGQRSNRAISATMCSYPAIPGKSMMLRVEGQQKIPSIASILKEQGYSTHFIYGGDVEFDNMRGFLQSKGVDNFVGDKDFDTNFINKWGALDGDMYDKALQVFDENAKNPFVALVYTLTNHEPFDLPENIDFEQKKYVDDEKLNKNLNTFRYADRELGRFISEFSKRDYFKNTIFFIYGDHSKTYHHDLSFDYRKSHVPLLIYAPTILDTAYVCDKLCGQIDIAPTVLELLNLDSVNSFFGTSLFSTKPGFAHFQRGAKFGFLEDGYYYTGLLGENDFLYRFNDFSGTDLSGELPKIKEKLKKDAFSIMQTSYQLYINKRIAK